MCRYTLLPPLTLDPSSQLRLWSIDFRYGLDGNELSLSVKPEKNEQVPDHGDLGLRGFTQGYDDGLSSDWLISALFRRDGLRQNEA